MTGTQIVVETPVTNVDLNELTSVHPEWRSAFWNVIHVVEWLEPMRYDHLQHTTNELLKLLDPLKKLSPGGGAYVNEAHYLEPNWQQAYYGSHHGKLLAVKNHYDPTYIFYCFKCVGWRGEKDYEFNSEHTAYRLRE
ncbi:hypothetical protein M441DRAFT_32369 [Trichoderma asperellum CBS 433.97]|uniref:Berberine/berberine-like domain-containing protein n=2 Tax=Trichoderma asperellum TaxID=101201 RepID=A0A2T3YR11_TRIA4|nr:hypothetical protein M441DRAFT_32369 [Trichoderma asperellum CBS 433.97]PTB34957.1 hypothetical protein M441DRAFT_32369 [Trichoderma asperellum CBS 433.97]